MCSVMEGGIRYPGIKQNCTDILQLHWGRHRTVIIKIVILVQEQCSDCSYEFGSQGNDLKVTPVKGVFRLACTGFGLRIWADLWAYVQTHKNAKTTHKMLISKERLRRLLVFLLFLFFMSIMFFGVVHFSQSCFSIVNCSI